MKINFSSYDDIENPYYAGGGTIAVHQVAMRLARNHRVTVYTSAYRNSKVVVRDGVVYKRIGLPLNVGGKISQLLFQLLLPIKAITDKNFDLWIESFTPPYSTSFLPLFTKKPVIGLTHLLSGKDMSQKYGLPFERLEKIGIKKYKYIIALTQNLKENVLQINPKCKVKIIPNGIEFPKNYIFKDLHKKHILYIGRIDIYQKGLDLLLKAYANSAAKSKYRLVVAGHGKNIEISNLKGLIEKYNLADKVILIGKVKGKLKSKLFKESIMTVLPSRFESFGIVALEAFYYGSPVLVFDIEGLRWIDSKYCVKARAFDEDDLSQKMDGFATNDKMSKELVKSAKKFIKNFDWDAIAKEYEDFVISTYENENKK